jgi:hypothetical protein
MAVGSTIWFQISLGLSVLTACIPSLKGVIDSLLGATAVTTIQGPYILRSSGNKSGLTATRVTDDSKQASGETSKQASGSSGPKAPKRKSLTLGLSTRDAVQHTAAASRSRSRNYSGGDSESVRNPTEGVIIVRDEIEVAYDSRSGSAMGGGSHASVPSSEYRFRA